MLLSHTTEDKLLGNWSGDELNFMSWAAIMQSIGTRFPSLGPVTRQVIYNVLAELTSNILNHAYPNGFESEKRWHISLFQCDTDSIRVEVADKGITIPKSISTKISGTARASEEHIPQSEFIRYAITSEYCAGKDGRGQGLASIIRLIDSGHVQLVAINSGLGSWSRSASGTFLVDRDTVLEGTTVSVVVSVPEGMQ